MLPIHSRVFAHIDPFLALFRCGLVVMIRRLFAPWSPLRQEAMRTRICFAQITLFITLTFLAAGCRQEPGALAQVTGRVTYKGTPVHGGIIVFSPDPDKGGHGPIAHSVIQEDGSFSLLTGDAPGAHAGFYRIAVSCPGAAASPSSQGYNTPESILDVKYQHPATSEISCKVNLDQPNSFNFDLK